MAIHSERANAAFAVCCVKTVSANVSRCTIRLGGTSVRDNQRIYGQSAGMPVNISARQSTILADFDLRMC
jgi:hypothetical protein